MFILQTLDITHLHLPINGLALRRWGNSQTVIKVGITEITYLSSMSGVR